MTDNNLLNLLIEIRDSDIFYPTKETYQIEGFSTNLKKAESFGLVQRYGKLNTNFRLSKSGYQVIESAGDLSVLDEKSIMVNATNAHIGDNSGKYTQSSDNNLTAETPAKTPKKNAIKSITLWTLIVAIIAIIVMIYLDYN